MPSKNSPRTRRPPSPYSVSQSPRSPSVKKAWRPLNGTGYQSPNDSFAASARESWLKSLRQGDPRSRMSGGANLSASSSSKYLAEQLGLAHSKKHKMSNSVGDLSGTPRYKSQEDMYDEIISLKKTASLNKVEYDSLKAKLRRVEEENIRKEKYIEQLLEIKMSDESIQKLAEGKSQSGNSTTARLKQRLLKLEKRLREKEKELTTLQSDMKVTDIQEMKTALEVYHQEVMRLRQVSSTQQYELERTHSSLNSEREGTPRKVRMLRKNILQLTAENNQLTEENQSLKTDLEQVLGEASDLYDEENGINYGALSKAELVSIITKLKQSKRQNDDVHLTQQDNEHQRLKRLIEKLKEQKNDLRTENEELREKSERHLRDLNEIRAEQKELRGKEKSRRQSSARSDSGASEERASTKRDTRMRDNPVRQNNAALSIQRQWRNHKIKQKQKDDDIVLLQSAFRGHNLRQKHLTHEEFGSEADEVESEYDDDISEASDEVVLLQSAMRGHLERVNKGY